MTYGRLADESARARYDVSVPAASDASREALHDASRHAAADASLGGERDPSPRGGRDVSHPDPRDTSHASASDASPRSPNDASAQVLRDTSAVVESDVSLGDEPDVSGLTGADASRPLCAWCGGPIPARARRDSICCSKRCRQARHRFGRAAGRAQAADPGRPLRLAYADPPYPGKAHLYRDHPDYAGEVDHAALIARLATYDGWALSTSAAALPAVLALCPPGVRVAAWHRGERPGPSWQPLSAWEPVIYVPGRPVDPSHVDGRRVDSLVYGMSPMLTLPGRVTGTKPGAFCRWLFGLLGAAPGDSLDDLFPGSGAVGRAWAAYTGQEPPDVEHDASRHPTADATAGP